MQPSTQQTPITVAEDIADLTAALEAAEAQARALRDEKKMMRDRIERLRGMLKTNAGWWYELSDDDKGDICMEVAGDMEPPLMAAERVANRRKRPYRLRPG